VQEVGREPPTWALRPALRQSMQSTEDFGNATPISLGLGRFALHVVGIGTGTVNPSRLRCLRSSVSHARSASLLAPRRPTARGPWRRTLHTSLATPPESGSMRAASSPQFVRASHPIPLLTRISLKYSSSLQPRFNSYDLPSSPTRTEMSFDRFRMTSHASDEGATSGNRSTLTLHKMPQVVRLHLPSNVHARSDQIVRAKAAKGPSTNGSTSARSPSRTMVRSGRSPARAITRLRVSP
jgi:hypothetical protein